VNPTFVNVAVTVAERSAVRTLVDIPVKVVIGTGRLVEVTPVPETVSVVIAGRAEKLDALDPEAMFAYVDCGGLAAGGSYELPVQVHAPGNLTVQEVMPQSVKATLGTP
jgi:YbbR domain-containing protein